MRLDRLDDVAAYVADVTRRAHPALDIPYHSRWSHFGAGGVDRMGQLGGMLAALAPDEHARWRYTEAGTGQPLVTFARSEGLAVASFHMFLAGTFSSDAGARLRADADALMGLAAGAILGAVLEGLGPIWPGRVAIGGVNLGDVWRHPAAGGRGPGAGLVPFHKLCQWLAYSLIEPLEAAGIRVVDVDALTGLPEYRNGGLLVDMGALVPRHEEVTAPAHAPGAEVIVEWRALTVALLDRVAERVRSVLGLHREQMPLAKVLEGGTWSAGRQIARTLRADGSPPIRIESDDTVF